MSMNEQLSKKIADIYVLHEDNKNNMAYHFSFSKAAPRMLSIIRQLVAENEKARFGLSEDEAVEVMAPAIMNTPSHPKASDFELSRYEARAAYRALVNHPASLCNKPAQLEPTEAEIERVARARDTMQEAFEINAKRRQFDLSGAAGTYYAPETLIAWIMFQECWEIAIAAHEKRFGELERMFAAAKASEALREEISKIQGEYIVQLQAQRRVLKNALVIASNEREILGDSRGEFVRPTRAAMLALKALVEAERLGKEGA